MVVIIQTLLSLSRILIIYRLISVELLRLHLANMARVILRQKQLMELLLIIGELQFLNHLVGGSLTLVLVMKLR